MKVWEAIARLQEQDQDLDLIIEAYTEGKEFGFHIPEKIAEVQSDMGDRFVFIGNYKEHPNEGLN